MKRFTHLALFTACAVLASCNKANTNTTVSPQKLVSEIYEDGGCTTFKYDSQNRLINVNRSDYVYDTYEYNENTIKMSRSSEDLDRTETSTYSLNNSGQLTRWELLSEYSNNNYSKDLILIEYENGTMSKRIDFFHSDMWGTTYDYTAEYSFSWQDSNISSCRDSDSFVAEFEYYNIEDKSNINIFNYLEGFFSEMLPDLKFSGTFSKQLIKSITRRYEDGALIEEYTYDFDSDGYPTKVKIRTIDSYNLDEYSEEYTIRYY